MGWRRFLAAGVLLAGCASAAADAATPTTATVAPVATSASSPSPSSGPTASSTPITVASPSPATCADDPGGGYTSEPVAIDDWVVGAERLVSGDVRLVARAATGQVLSLGCMGGDTADAGLELGLSLASVQPVAEGVRVVIAIPAGRQLMPLAWLEDRSAAETSAGYDVRVFLATAPPSVDGATPTVAQLAGLVTEAFGGTSSVAGLAPDILEPA